MPTQVQWRRGTTLDHSSFTGAAGEVTIDTDKKVLIVHDGSTLGGIPTITQDIANSIFRQANSAYISQNTTGTYANTAYLHANSAYISQNSSGQY